MLFNDILNQKYDAFKPLFDQLFELAISNQTHSGDLLLAMEHASLRDEPDYDDGGKMKMFYRIGTDMDYHCETANHDFIKHYIKGTVGMPFADYRELHENPEKRPEEIDLILAEETTTIQVEMLIYLKIWEGETFLKKMYQVSRLISGLDYDWHLALGYGSNKSPGEMERWEILRGLKQNLLENLPDLHAVIERNHRSQLRNAIAHSQYAMLNRYIMLNNYKAGKAGHRHGLDFNEWVDVFHETLTIFTLYEMLFNRIREHYYQESLPFNKKKEVRVNRLYPNTASFLSVLHRREYFKDWGPYPEA
jgi:hypothetical protein